MLKPCVRRASGRDQVHIWLARSPFERASVELGSLLAHPASDLGGLSRP